MHRFTDPREIHDDTVREIACTVGWIAALDEAAYQLEQLLQADDDPPELPPLSDDVAPWDADPLSVALAHLREMIAISTNQAEERLAAWLRADMPIRWDILHTIFPAWQDAQAEWLHDAPDWIAQLDVIAAGANATYGPLHLPPRRSPN